VTSSSVPASDVTRSTSAVARNCPGSLALSLSVGSVVLVVSQISMTETFSLDHSVDLCFKKSVVLTQM